MEIGIFCPAGWSSLVAREAHNLEVVGSNPAPATFESRWILSNGFFRFLGRGSGDPSIGSHPLSQTPVEIASFHLPPPTQHRQIDIWIILGKIGFECISAQAEGFLKAVGRKPSGEGSSVVSHAQTLGKPLDI